MIKPELTNMKCLKCGYSWDTLSSKQYVSCPNCLRKVKKIEEEKDDKEDKDDSDDEPPEPPRVIYPFLPRL